MNRLVRPAGLEPATSAMSRQRSTAELRTRIRQPSRSTLPTCDSRSRSHEDTRVPELRSGMLDYAGLERMLASGLPGRMEHVRGLGDRDHRGGADDCCHRGKDETDRVHGDPHNRRSSIPSTRKCRRTAMTHPDIPRPCVFHSTEWGPEILRDGAILGNSTIDPAARLTKASDLRFDTRHHELSGVCVTRSRASREGRLRLGQRPRGLPHRGGGVHRVRQAAAR